MFFRFLGSFSVVFELVSWVTSFLRVLSAARLEDRLVGSLRAYERRVLSRSAHSFVDGPLHAPLFGRLLGGSPYVRSTKLKCRYVCFSGRLMRPVSLAHFSCGSVPGYFTPITVRALGRANVLPIRGCPTLRLGKGNILVKFLSDKVSCRGGIFHGLSNAAQVTTL